jgi:hypothetical protein
MFENKQRYLQHLHECCVIYSDIIFSVRGEWELYRIRTANNMIFLISVLVLSTLFFWHTHSIFYTNLQY